MNTWENQTSFRQPANTYPCNFQQKLLCPVCGRLFPSPGTMARGPAQCRPCTLHFLQQLSKCSIAPASCFSTHINTAEQHFSCCFATGSHAGCTSWKPEPSQWFRPLFHQGRREMSHQESETPPHCCCSRQVWGCVPPENSSHRC